MNGIIRVRIALWTNRRLIIFTNKHVYRIIHAESLRQNVLLTAARLVPIIYYCFMNYKNIRLFPHMKKETEISINLTKTKNKKKPNLFILHTKCRLKLLPAKTFGTQDHHPQYQTTGDCLVALHSWTCQTMHQSSCNRKGKNRNQSSLKNHHLHTFKIAFTIVLRHWFQCLSFYLYQQITITCVNLKVLICMQSYSMFQSMHTIDRICLHTHT